MRDESPQWETEAAERQEELLLQRAKQSLGVGQNAVPPLPTPPCCEEAQEWLRPTGSGLCGRMVQGLAVRQFLPS